MEVVKRGSLLIAVLVVCLGANDVACGGTSGPGTDADAAKVARTYMNAYNRRDGRTMCAQFSSELRDWFARLPGLRGNPGCAKNASARIGYGEESDTPIFQRLTILSATPSVAGENARVTVRARYRFKHFPKPLSRVITDQIYLGDRDGTWRVVKPGGVWFYTQSAYNIPENTLDPPITDAEAHQPAPQPAASFECAAAAASKLSDPAGDAPAPLDVQSASVSFNPDKSACFRIAFKSPPRPGTTVELRLELHHTGTRFVSMISPSIRIGSGGQFHITHKTQRFEAGWDHGELRIHWFAQKGYLASPYTLRWGGVTRTFQFWEPLISSPMLGAGEPWEGRGDSFGHLGF
jgi:hypothetical protein